MILTPITPTQSKRSSSAMVTTSRTLPIVFLPQLLTMATSTVTSSHRRSRYSWTLTVTALPTSMTSMMTTTVLSTVTKWRSVRTVQTRFCMPALCRFLLAAQSIQGLSQLTSLQVQLSRRYTFCQLTIRTFLSVRNISFRHLTSLLTELQFLLIRPKHRLQPRAVASLLTAGGMLQTS